ncbi:hypothetical protein B5F14_07770 [Faecalitalea cylindroides]|uniref:Polysaccharide biosynthesis protein C-terminal domain-containing protein n=1 Tax=Faecalitalea cylindroides TaxID=39483 RepID=A0A1Y4LQQ1_9FIRM|nr:hypothetical protein [Faecalitalea cylindroides]OUP58976.1 hypothetical protein B5F14_07770 [Faecalitalea cylindroides]
MNNLKKDYFWNTLGTSLFSFNSLFLMIVVTRLNSLSDAGIFSFAYATAGIINYFALYSGRTYQISNTDEKFTDSLYIVARYLTALFALLITIIFIVINGYSLEKALVIFLLCMVKCFEAISDVYYGILQRNSKLFIAGKSMTYKTLIIIIGFVVIDFLTRNLLTSCFYMLILNIVFLLVYDIRNTNKFSKFIKDFDNFNIFLLLKVSSYTFLFTLIVTIIMNLPRYFIDFFLNDSDQAIYGIISMPATFVMLFSQFIFQPSLVSLTGFYKQNDKKSFNLTVLRISSILIGAMIIILPVAYIFGIPVLEFVYGVELSNYLYYLLLVILGSSFYAVSNVLLNSLIVIHCNREQLFVQVIILLLSLLICYELISNLGIEGGLLSYFSILLLQFIIYFILYRYIINKKFIKTDERC